MTKVNVMWLCTTGKPVGIVRGYDEIEGRWKFFIGTGEGHDLDEDVQLIIDFGQKFYNMDFLKDFVSPANEGDDT